jgi:hypothetical protein
LIDPPERGRQEPVDDTSLDGRRFTDREVQEILKRAVERSPSKGLARTESDGLSLAELKSIAGEVGIDPQRVELAARHVASKGTDRSNRVVGAPTVVNFERRVEGEINPEDTPEILGVIRRVMGQQGEASEIHGSLEWTVKGDVGERYVTLSSRDGTTTITGSANLTNAAILTYLPTGIVGLMVSLVGFLKYFQDGSQVGLILFFAVLPILYPILRTLFSKISRTESAKLQRVVEELARFAEPDRT